MAEDYYDYDEENFAPRKRDNLFLWTVFILLLIGLAFTCWLGSFYIFGHPEQARVYYEALSRAEVPGVRLVANQDFSFTAGIDVTDVRQSKGLEFDIVILLDVNDASYPERDDARRLLHVAMTRAAHQLWVTYTGNPSPLLPPALR